MLNPLKQKLGVEGLAKLSELIKREVDIRNISEDFETHKMAIELLLKWVGSIYEIDAKQIIEEQPEIDLEKLFKDKE